MDRHEELRPLLQGYALALCGSLAACHELQGVLALLSQAVALLLDACEQPEQQHGSAESQDEQLEACRRSLAAAAAAAAAAAEQQPSALLRPLFYASAAFQDLAETLLTVVAPDWLPRFSGEQRRRLVDPWFEAAPAAALLPALASHLAAVQPSSAPGRAGRVRVTAVSAEEAGALLAARFAAPGSSGVCDLLQHVQAAAAAAVAAGGDASAAAATAAAPAVESLAAALASVPERAAGLELPLLEPAAFVPAVAGELLRLLTEQQAQQAPQQQQQQPAASTVFAADVLGRFCRRGHQQQVAAALLAYLQQEQAGPAAAVVGSLVAAMPDSAAIDRLLEAALLGAASAATAAAGSSSPPLDASPSADPAAQAVAAMLAALVPPPVWQVRADARLALADKLLVQQQRRWPPLPALRGLLLFLQRQAAAPGGSGDSGASGGSLLAEAAARVAQLWGDAGAVQRLAPPHQAYLTAALCGCLALLSRAELDGQPALLGLLLGGVTTRLDSPLLSVRRQAQRVGQALSALLDPSKPPMFSEDAEQLRQLLPEERWEPGQQAAAAAAGAVVHQQHPPAAPESANPRQRRRKERAARRAAAAAARTSRERQQREGGAEGPLTETDSDDQGWSDSSLASSGSSGSGSSMEAYSGLEESDEEDPARSRLQLRDLPKLLLSGAEADWRGQLRALRHAEHLIRAAPDELAQYAVPIARALVHTKVPGWMDEEMPQQPSRGGGGAPTAGPPLTANMQRFRDVVALLAGAPEPAGLALAAEMYGPSMDMYQRAMILDGMAAAAAEIAKPGASLPPLPGLNKKPARQLDGAVARAEAAVATAAAAGLTPEQQRLLTTTADGSRRVGTVTRLATRSLAAAARQQGAEGRINRFPAIALKWAAALLRHCDEPQHGIDLLGKDSFLLGKLLVTLGAFLEASAQSSEAATLAAATLELMRLPRVHAHPEPYVRRAALLAAGQVLGAVPPARLATAMLGAAAGSQLAAPRDAADDALVSRLEWLREWGEGVAASDPDDSCRMMAEGVRKLQGHLASGALAALDSGAPAGPLGGGGLLPLGGGGGRGGVGVSVGLPDIGSLSLPDIRLP